MHSIKNKIRLGISRFSSLVIIILILVKFSGTAHSDVYVHDNAGFDAVYGSNKTDHVNANLDEENFKSKLRKQGTIW